MVHEIAISTLSPVNDAQFNHPHTNVVTLWTGTEVWIFVVYSDSTALRIARSSNGGQTFVESTLQATTGLVGPSVWYDRWTPGDTTGNILHIAACDPANETLRYFSWNLSSHTVGGTTNIPIHTFTSISGAAASADGGTTICKGANGYLYAAAKATTTAGWAVRQSTDSGASWSDITAQGTNFNTENSQVDDNVILVPCSTTDDIMAVEFDDSADLLKYQIYDDSANSWSAATTIESGLDNLAQSQQWPSIFNVTLDKTTSDIYLVYWRPFATSTITVGDLIFRKFTVSSSSWGLAKLITRIGTTNLYVDQLMEFGACAIERDQTNGKLVVYYMLGAAITNLILYIKTSSDDGVTWSGSKRPDITSDDHRYLACPLVMNNINEGWYCVWTNDDTDTIYGLQNNASSAINTINYKTISGNVKDSGGNNVSGAVVDMFNNDVEIQYEYQEKFFTGRGITDASGNYKILLLPIDNTEYKYQGIINYDRVEKEIKIAPTTTLTNSIGTLYASKFSGLTSGDKIKGVTIHLTGVSVPFRVKAYDEVSSEPTNLLGESGDATHLGNVVHVLFTSEVTVPANGIIWIGVESTLATSFIRENNQSSGTTKTVAHTYGTGPDPFGTPTNQTYALWIGIFGTPQVDATIGELSD